MIWMSASAEQIEITFPENQWVRSGEVVLSTDPEHPIGTPHPDDD